MGLIKYQTIHINHTEGELITDKSILVDKKNMLVFKDFVNYEKRVNSKVITLHTIDTLWVHDEEPCFQIETVSKFLPLIEDEQMVAQIIMTHLSHREVTISEGLVKSNLPEIYLLQDENAFKERLNNVIAKVGAFVKPNEEL